MKGRMKLKGKVHVKGLGKIYEVDACSSFSVPFVSFSSHRPLNVGIFLTFILASFIGIDDPIYPRIFNNHP